MECRGECLAEEGREEIKTITTQQEDKMRHTSAERPQQIPRGLSCSWISPTLPTLHPPRLKRAVRMRTPRGQLRRQWVQSPSSRGATDRATDRSRPTSVCGGTLRRCRGAVESPRKADEPSTGGEVASVVDRGGVARGESGGEIWAEGLETGDLGTGRFGTRMFRARGFSGNWGDWGDWGDWSDWNDWWGRGGKRRPRRGLWVLGWEVDRLEWRRGVHPGGRGPSEAHW